MARKAKRKQRETYGDGSIVPKLDANGNQRVDREGKLVWHISLFLGTETFIDSKGKTRKKQKRIRRDYHGTLSGARKYRDELLAQYENVDLEAAQGTFAWACSKWLTSMRNSNTASADVIKSYETRLGYMERHLGDSAIIEITATDIDEAISAVKSERKLSNTTMHKVFAVTKRVFEFAESRDWIVKNPCKAALAPKEDEVTNRIALSREDGIRLRSKLDQEEESAFDEFKGKELRQLKNGKAETRASIRGLSSIGGIIAIRIMLATGMRRGEVCGLVWDAVNFRKRQITVRQSLTAKVSIKKPKTDSGIRTLSIDADTMAHIARWKKLQSEALSALSKVGVCAEQSDETPVICNDLGSWLDPTNLGRWWDAFRREIGFPGLKMHELRHTQATVLIGNGTDIKTVAHRLGHKKESLTLSQYAHAIPANDEAAADLIGALFAEPLGSSATESLKKTA